MKYFQLSIYSCQKFVCSNIATRGIGGFLHTRNNDLSLAYYYVSENFEVESIVFLQK